jgi:hypothetical protein
MARPAHELPMLEALQVRVLLATNAIARGNQLRFIIALGTVVAAPGIIICFLAFLSDRATHLSHKGGSWRM